MSTDPKTNKDELTDEQAGKIAGGRLAAGGGSDGSLDPTKIKNVDGATQESPDASTRDYSAE